MMFLPSFRYLTTSKCVTRSRHTNILYKHNFRYKLGEIRKVLLSQQQSSWNWWNMIHARRSRFAHTLGLILWTLSVQKVKMWRNFSTTNKLESNNIQTQTRLVFQFYISLNIIFLASAWLLHYWNSKSGYGYCPNWHSYKAKNLLDGTCVTLIKKSLLLWIENEVYEVVVF